MQHTYSSIHFIGIGGISMSGLAELMLSEGSQVFGSDSRESDMTDMLRQMGATVYIGHSAQNIKKDIDLVVYTSAVSEDNEELARSRELNLNIMDRAEFLGYIMKNYKNAICISGTHGKTTTTGMMASVLMETTLEPTIFLGGVMDSIGGNLLRGSEKMMLTEACEYKRNFLKFSPTAAIILNMEEDHLDYYKDLNDIKQAFSKFADMLPENGVLVVNKNDADCFRESKCAVITFGLDDSADYYPENINYYPKPSFDFMHNKIKITRIQLDVRGEHNVTNAVAAAALAMFYSITPETIARGLGKFSGTHRRYQEIGTWNGTALIDDYAHHPTEIIGTLHTARTYTAGNVITVFQPHTYTRTKSLLDDFAVSLKQSDMTILLDIYPAREIDDGTVSSLDLLNKMKAIGANAIYAPTFEDAVKEAKKLMSDGDTLITMGAGNVNKLMEYFK